MTPTGNLGRESCAPFPAPMVGARATHSLGPLRHPGQVCGNVPWLGKLPLDSTSPSPSGELVAVDPCDGSLRASKRAEGHELASRFQTSVRCSDFLRRRPLPSAVRHSCPSSCRSSQSCRSKVGPKCFTYGFMSNHGSEVVR